MNGNDAWKLALDERWDGNGGGEDAQFDDGFEASLSACEWGLPLTGENFATGEPLVTADYFDLVPHTAENACGIAEALLTLDGAIDDHGASCPRVLVLDDEGVAEPCPPRAIVAIATVLDDGLRVETARASLTDVVRERVEALLCARVRHRRRVSVNPCDLYLLA